MRGGKYPASETFQYFMHDGARAFRFTLSGVLDAAGAAELERALRTAWRTIGKRTFIVDLSYLTSCDSQGGKLLRYWHTTGAQFVCESARSRHHRTRSADACGNGGPA